jgi:predicted NBD/HSP70 family sugar kinase
MRINDQAYNRLSALRKLRTAEPVSRTELARLTGLNGGTITAIVRDLVERGLILEERIPSPGRGRPRVNLRINPEGAYVVGATMTDDARLLAEVADLRGQSVAAGSAAFQGTASLKNLARQFSDLIRNVIAASPITPDRIAQIGIGLPAIVDSRTGVVEFFETFADLPFPFAAAIEDALRIPTRIDNNINLLARAEHWFGNGTGVEDFTLILLDLGLGAARYQAGQLVVGSHGLAIELGHTKIVPEGGRPCHCGGHGCLQAYSSISAVVYQAAEQAGEAPPQVLDLRESFADLVQRAHAGDAAIIALFENAGRLLGRGIANHINMQDPGEVIILTRGRDLVELISGPFFEALNRDTLAVLDARERTMFKQADDASFARGAAAMVLEQLYQDR